MSDLLKKGKRIKTILIKKNALTKIRLSDKNYCPHNMLLSLLLRATAKNVIFYSGQSTKREGGNKGFSKKEKITFSRFF